MQRRARGLVALPLELRVDHHRAGRPELRRLRASQVPVGVAGLVREAARLPALDAVEGAGLRHLVSDVFPAQRTAVVTGAGSVRGIGRATADRLAQQGWSVAVLDLDGEGARDAAAQLVVRHGVRAIGLAADVADESSVGAAIALSLIHISEPTRPY